MATFGFHLLSPAASFHLPIRSKYAAESGSCIVIRLSCSSLYLGGYSSAQTSSHSLGAMCLPSKLRNLNRLPLSLWIDFSGRIESRSNLGRFGADLTIFT